MQRTREKGGERAGWRHRKNYVKVWHCIQISLRARVCVCVHMCVSAC